MNHGQLPDQQTISEGPACDETELMEEHDISSVSTISKASSNLTDIDGGFCKWQLGGLKVAEGKGSVGG